MEVNYMYATEKNFEVCEAIIKILHESEISISQAYAILDRAKYKIVQDTKVGELICFEREDSLENP